MTGPDPEILVRVNVYGKQHTQSTLKYWVKIQCSSAVTKQGNKRANKTKLIELASGSES